MSLLTRIGFTSQRVFAIAILAFVVAMPAWADYDHRSLVLDRMGMFYVGGGIERERPNGFSKRRGQVTPQYLDEFVGQTLVHYFIPKNKERNPPVIFYPGLGLSAYMFMSTPDGRKGWAQIFAEAGFPVYIFDPVDTGPSGFGVAPFAQVGDKLKDSIEPMPVLPELTDQEIEDLPNLTKWNIPDVWSRWGFGQEEGVPNDGVRYPIDDVEQFYASWPPRASGGRGRGGGEGPSPNELAFTELLQMTGPAIIFLHSFAGGTGFEVARNNPDLVRGIVALEPTGCPNEEDEVPWDFAQIPFLAVYGDFIDQRNQGGRLASCQATADLVNAKGGTGEVIQLTERGIFGNTHLYPQDNNNAQIAAIVIKWLQKNVTPKRRGIKR